MKYSLLLVLVWFSLYSCQRVDDDDAGDFDSIGEIIGFDTTECACCGGYQIKFKERSEVFLFAELPSNATFTLNPNTQNFPLEVRANWTAGTSRFCSLFISIEDIEVVE